MSIPLESIPSGDFHTCIPSMWADSVARYCWLKLIYFYIFWAEFIKQNRAELLLSASCQV